MMATTVYETKVISTISGSEIEVGPLKIKYLRPFMDMFDLLKESKDDEESIELLSKCVQIAMKQFAPELSHSVTDIEDNFDLPTIYNVLDSVAGIKMKKKNDESVKDQAAESEMAWKDLNLVKLESEAFLLGIWKDYDELESSLSMPELMAILESKREMDYEEKKFLAAIQGVDLDKNKTKEEDPWTKLKNKVFNQGRDDKDILTFKGDKAKRAGFGIGMGLDYEDLTK